MPDYSDLIPANLKPGLTTADGANLKPGLVTPAYSGGTPSAANQIKPSLRNVDGSLKAGLVLGSELKPSLVNADGPATPPWSPDSMFAASEIGGYYDPSDISSLWQDSAGTTPVTTDGDPVGKMDDLSGNGNHWTAVGTARPTYKTSGGKSWLEFDGADDYMLLAGPRMDLYNMTIGAAYSMGTAGSGNRGLLGWSASNSALFFGNIFFGLTLIQLSGYSAPTQSASVTTLATASVISSRRIEATGVGTVRQNGVEKAPTTTFTGVLAFDRLFALGTSIADGKLYGLVLCGAEVSDPQMLELEAYLGARI